MQINKESANYFVIFSGIIFFLIKWHQPFLLFDESIDVKIIFESVTDGYKYLPIFKSFAEINLNNSYDINLSNLDNLSAPVGSFYFHSLFYLFFKSWSFVIIELITIIIFLGIFYKISRLLLFKRLESLLISIFLYNLPILLDLTSISNLKYISIISTDFYSLRFPRPLISNLFFYYFILVSLSIFNKGELVQRKKFIILGILSGLSFTSFFYHFLIEQITLLICVIYLYRNKFLKYISENYISLIFFLISFLIVSLPLILNINFAEKDFLQRTGLLDLDFERKKILLKYSFKKFLDLKFLILIIFSIILYYFINNKENKNAFSGNTLFIFLFLSSIISPIIFIILSPSYFSHFYFFNNLTIIIFFLLIFFVSSKFLQINLLNKLPNKVFKFLLIILIFLIFSSNFYGVRNNYFSNQLSYKVFKTRSEINSIVNIIYKEGFDLSKSTLLTFDNKIMVWSILKDIKYLSVANGLFTPKKNEMIENDLIGSFKFLRLTEDDLRNFIKNKKRGWRYRNDNILDLFWNRYQANSLTTFNNSNDFDNEVLEFINKTSPIMSQQLIIPNFEIERFINKFENFNENYNEPNLIIINKKDSILAKSVIDPEIFCKIFDGEFYVFYHSINKDKKCN